MDATITQDAPTALTGFSREAVLDLSRRKGDPDWVRDARLAAWDHYETLPAPARTDEEWRRTDLRALKLDRLAPFAGLDQERVSLDALSQNGHAADRDGALAIGSADQRAGVVVQRDATTLSADVDPSLAAQGVIFCDLDTAVRDHADLVRRYFMTEAVPVGFGKYEALHAAFWQGGTFLYVPRNVSVELPFRSFAQAQEPGAAVFTHSLVVLEEGAEAFFVDAYSSPTQDKQSFASAVVELILRRDAKLRYVQVQDWGRHAWSFLTERATLADRAELKSLHVTLGSRFSKNSIGSHLRGEDTLAEMLGISFADGNQFFDHHTWQLHESPHATSDLEFKSALKGSARTVYSGLIKVSEGAQKTDAYQQNRNLVLSPTARADSIPNLEIAANDVRCTHGATISQVEEEHIFYLQARGIPRTEAQKLIVEGFFRPVIDRIPVEEIQGFLQAAIGRKVGM
ncbi:MAG: Iron-sulfur cluster assembly protein SufD [uncultured Thermomicrobiales bacterium]|uniref:Iron-sulfur cluster assembly protein SufD n=1 Tax=uncultured Thermomicrobiales bacterium TaxID=1645740 RepID=A0A6J4TP53_9BACT|nr:MAG: Iron-sulfur cluster assembly protein SufD [uncultured Thermomicrobiales bacterium]